MKKIRYKKVLAWLTAVLTIAQMLLMLVSWMLSATITTGIRSLLSPEGLRWMFGSITDIIASWPLAWLLFAAVAYGAVRKSVRTRKKGIRKGINCKLPYRDRMALLLVIIEIVIAAAMITLLSATPHAILLSATGHLISSPFSRSIIPYLALVVTVAALSFGLLSGRLKNIQDVFDAMTDGIVLSAPLFVAYIFVTQFVSSLFYIF